MGTEMHQRHALAHYDSLRQGQFLAAAPRVALTHGLGLISSEICKSANGPSSCPTGEGTHNILLASLALRAGTLAVCCSKLRLPGANRSSTAKDDIQVNCEGIPRSKLGQPDRLCPLYLFEHPCAYLTASASDKGLVEAACLANA